MLRQRRGGGGWERVFGEGCIGPVILKQDLEKSGCFKGGGDGGKGRKRAECKTE